MIPLEDFVWEHLGVAKHGIGRRKIRAMSWMAGELHAKGMPPQNISTQMCNSQRYGMGIISMLILSAIANQIVRLVIEWFRRKQAGEA